MSEIAELQGRTVGTGANYQENLSELGEYKIEAREVGETLWLWSELENAVPAEVATFGTCPNFPPVWRRLTPVWTSSSSERENLVEGRHHHPSNAGILVFAG